MVEYTLKLRKVAWNWRVPPQNVAGCASRTHSFLACYLLFFNLLPAISLPVSRYYQRHARYS